MKSIDVVNTVIAKNKSLDVKTVATVNKYFWKTVRRKVSNLESPSIFVKGLLTFTASRYNINRLIKKTILNIRLTRKSLKFGQVKREALLEKHYIHLRLLLKQRNRLANQYYNERNNRIS